MKINTDNSTSLLMPYIGNYFQTYTNPFTDTRLQQVRILSTDIFKLFRLQAFHRLSYLDHGNPELFRLMGSINFHF